jgi:hypothetical protein
LVIYGGSPPKHHTYTQKYRNGAIEAVHGTLLCPSEEKEIAYQLYEQTVLDYLPNCFRYLRELDCTGPVVIALTLTGVNDNERRGFIGVENLILPETIVEDLDSPPGKILKPIFDMVWNACGYAASRNFDADGNWVAGK